MNKYFLFQYGVFSKMYALRTLKLTSYSNIRDFNVARMLTYNSALKNLMVEADGAGIEFGKEFYGALPQKLNNITITGRALRYLTQYMLSVSIKDKPHKLDYSMGMRVCSRSEQDPRVVILATLETSQKWSNISGLPVIYFIFV